MSERPPGEPVPPSYQGYPPSRGAEPGYAQQPAPQPVQQPVQPGPPPAYAGSYGGPAGAPPPLPVRRGQAHPHPEPRGYAQMLRTWDYAVWKPIVGIVALLLGGVVVAPLVLLPVLAAGVAIEGGSGTFGSRFDAALNLDTVTPSAMLYLNLSLASLVLVAMAIERWVHRLRPRWLFSVRPGIRWRFLFVCLGLSVVALMAQVVVGIFLPSQGNDLGPRPTHVTGTLVALALVVLLTTPLQAMGEEFAFRGYLTQAVGSLTFGWSKNPVVARRISTTLAVVVPALLFALAHGAQNGPLFVDRFAFGLLAGYLVVRVGGLEAGIALHILNNLLAFGAALAFGDITASLKVSHVSWWNIVLTVTQNGVYLVLVLLVARRMGITATSTPPVPEEAVPVATPEAAPIGD